MTHPELIRICFHCAGESGTKEKGEPTSIRCQEFRLSIEREEKNDDRHFDLFRGVDRTQPIIKRQLVWSNHHGHHMIAHMHNEKRILKFLSFSKRNTASNL